MHIITIYYASFYTHKIYWFRIKTFRHNQFFLDKKKLQNDDEGNKICRCQPCEEERNGLSNSFTKNQVIPMDSFVNVEDLELKTKILSAAKWTEKQYVVNLNVIQIYNPFVLRAHYVIKVLYANARFIFIWLDRFLVKIPDWCNNDFVCMISIAHV